ncbi:MAG: hypothetical protein AAFW00_16770 [Bacteroidota bacterium]
MESEIVEIIHHGAQKIQYATGLERRAFWPVADNEKLQKAE